MDLLDYFFQERIPAFLVHPNGRQQTDISPPTSVLPGSFNPLHAAHLQLADVACQLLNHRPHFELCVNNVDKPLLSADTVRDRLQQFAGKHSVWVTRSATFVEKSRIFPGTTFVVGADTAARIVAPRYYPEGETGVADALSVMRERDCRFLVAGRRDQNGELIHLGALPIPSRFADLFVEIPQDLFHVDLSSTELRDRS